MKKLLMVVCGLVLLTGCLTRSRGFVASSAPIPPKGYTVVGDPVEGTSTQVWLFGLGGSLSSQQFAALRNALDNAPEGTDALVSMAIDDDLAGFLFIYESLTTRVTGVPVKFNR